MSDRILKFVPVPARRLYTARDFWEECHVESDPLVKLILSLHATTNPRDFGKPYLCHVAPPKEGERECQEFWHEKGVSLRIREEALHGDRFSQYREFFRQMREQERREKEMLSRSAEAARKEPAESRRTLLEQQMMWEALQMKKG